MGKALADAFAPARQVFDEVDAALGERLSDTIWNGPAEALTLTENAQPALMAVSLAALRVLEAEAGVDLARDAAFVAGHSLGEYSALAAARRIYDCRRGAAVADPRSRHAEGGSGRGRRHGGADRGRASMTRKRLLPKRRSAACARPQTTMAAARSCCPATKARSRTRGRDRQGATACKRAMMLPVSAPFHCPLMQPAADAMAEALAKVAVKPPRRAARRQCAGAADQRIRPTIVRVLVEQVTGTVRWRESVLFMAQAGVTTFYEIGAGKVLTGLIKRIAEAADVIFDRYARRHRSVQGARAAELCWRCGRTVMFELTGKTALITGATGPIGGSDRASPACARRDRRHFRHAARSARSACRRSWRARSCAALQSRRRRRDGCAGAARRGGDGPARRAGRQRRRDARTICSCNCAMKTGTR